tara:strand:+ start:821 stop:1474 length:654 start_codon:yes stop_codon:yes gene_type:complete
MNTLGDRIRNRRKELKYSQRELAQRVGVSHVTVSQWESDIMKIKGENLYKLAKVINVSARWLLDGKGSQAPDIESNLENAPLPTKTKKLPIISNVQAGNWSEAIDFNDINDKVNWEDAPESASDHAFWLRVVGDSMTAPMGLSIVEGMLILVDPDVSPESGKLVVAKLDGTDEATFKKLVIDAGMKFLKPLNPSYPSITINGNCRIIGVVKEIKYKL